MAEKKLNGTVIVTYRCNARCSMCNRYKAPSKPEEEISIETIKKLPKMYFTNITGGEPFIRTDLKDIVRELYKKSDRIVISTNGFFTDRIVELCKEFPQIGIRISIEGLEQTNNEIRGLEDGFNRGYTTLKKLVEMGMKDVGFGMTVQDKNAPDLVPLYKISDEMGMEFATASLHNSFYFVLGYSLLIVATTVVATTAAVSVRRRSRPREIALNPFWSAKLISSFEKSPSGPIKISVLAPFFTNFPR